MDDEKSIISTKDDRSLYRILGIVLICTLAVCGSFAFYAGLFDPVHFTLEKPGPFKIIYKEYQGPHQGVRMVMNQVYRYVRDSLGLSTDTGCVVFYTTPDVTKDDALRCMCGIVVDTNVAVSSLYKTGTIDRADAVVGRCYLRSFFSYMTGSYKFYTELAKFMEKNSKKRNGPVFELYDMTHRTLIYSAPCNNGTSPVPIFSGK